MDRLTANNVQIESGKIYSVFSKILEIDLGNIQFTYKSLDRGDSDDCIAKFFNIPEGGIEDEFKGGIIKGNIFIYKYNICAICKCTDDHILYPENIEVEEVFTIQ